MNIGAADYVHEVKALVDEVSHTQGAAVRKAAGLLVGSLMGGGIIQAFGSGHLEAIAMEIAGRAGGLVPSNRLALRDVVLYGDAPVDVLLGAPGELERDPSIAQRIYDLAPVQPQDVFVLISSSGVNGSVVELASIVKDRGHGLVALTSVQHSTAMASATPRAASCSTSPTWCWTTGRRTATRFCRSRTAARSAPSPRSPRRCWPRWW